MTIANFNTAQARIEANTDGLHIAADVNIRNGRAADIGNGHVARTDDGTPTPVADFSSYTGATHHTFYGAPALSEQIALMTAIDAFCTEVRAATFTLAADQAWN